ncbi:nidogen-1-like [Ptychodera flava]|uniref:nidogen-1-like n=1 Tax=Ptychodera flava TaxID=63121 RepID=UPI00396AA1EF
MDTAGVLRLAAILLLCSVQVNAVFRNQFYFFGDRVGDQAVPRGDVETVELYLETPISFYDEPHYTVYLNTDGVLTFTPGLQGYPPYPFGTQLRDTNIKLIAPFMVDLDNSDQRQTGNIWYRETDDITYRQRANQEIRRYFSDSNFEADSLLIVTWEEIAIYKRDGGQTVMTFQLILANDGKNTYAVFLYDDRNKDPELTTDGLAWPEIGFYAGDRRRFFNIDNSMTEDVFQESRRSNVNKAGFWIWQIGMENMGDRNVVDPSQSSGFAPDISSGDEEGDIVPSESVDIFDVDVFDIDDSKERCGECSPNARCAANAVCCECFEDYYGNGLICLERNKPQRVNGKMTGTVNGIDIDRVDLHAYAVTNEGRAYTAVSRIPPNIGYPMQAMQPLGALVGWMFAMTASKGRNGFEITGGELTRTANLIFETGESMIIKERYTGIDELGYMRMTAEIDGTLPQISADDRITMDDYKDTYNRNTPGVIRSFSQRTLHLGNDRSIDFTVDQTIEYEECIVRNPQQEESLIKAMRSSIQGNYVVYDRNEQILRYAMTSKVTPSTDQPDNPCQSNDCDRNADCQVQGDSYECRCRRGYEGSGRNCYDIDECRLGTARCDRNARCVNEVGAFYCECRPGYTGDGRSCTRARSCETANCDRNARCIDRGSDISCECLPGYTGDGRQCTREEDRCERAGCDPNARCIDQGGTAYCQCLPGFTGDGRQCRRAGGCDTADCDSNAQCIEQDGIAYCRCLPGFRGDGLYCERDSACSRANCHRYARCNERNGIAYCQCLPGYVGDGRDCREQSTVDSAYLIFAQGMALYRMPLNEFEKAGRILIKPPQTAVGVDYDCRDSHIYWTDIYGKAIYRAGEDGSDMETLINKGLNSPEGIAVDWISRNMYWTDSGYDTIEVANLDGSNRRVIIPDGLVNPRGIAVDPVGSYLYWIDWNRAYPKIETSNLDGSDRRVLVDTGLKVPNGLTLDYLNHQICWADAGENKIECISQSGDASTRYTVTTEASYPFAMTNVNNRLYWTDWERKNIQTVDMNGGNLGKPMQPPIGANGKLYGITAASSCPSGSNACARDNGQCSHLCLPLPGGRHTCKCPTDQHGNEVPCVE